MKKTTLLLTLLLPRRACLWAALGLLLALAFGPPPARAAVTEAWVHRYNNVVTNVDDQPVKVVRDAAGDIIVTGNSGGDMLTIKYSGADGTVIWQHRYNSPTDGWDEARALAVDASGNVIVTGSSGGILDWGGYTYQEYYTVKYAAADGALLWEKRYNGPAWVDVRGVSRHSLALGPNGMVAITGTSFGDYATIVYWENLPPVSVELVPTGIRLRFTGIPGRRYHIQRAPAVTGPWTTLNTQTAPASGLIEYLDAPPLAGSAFYRTMQP